MSDLNDPRAPSSGPDDVTLHRPGGVAEGLGKNVADRFANLPQAALQLAVIGAVIASSLWVLAPFLGALLWATVIVVATWSPFLRLCAWLGGRRRLAIAVATIGLLSTLVLPLYLSVAAVVDNAEWIGGWSRSIVTLKVPEPPPWSEKVPLVGPRLSLAWSQMAAATPEERAAHLSPYLLPVGRWFASQVGSLGLMFVHFLLTVLISGVLYANGEAMGRGVVAFADRLGGSRGVEAVRLAEQAIRAVALGVVLTAILQSLAAGLGIWIAGVPFAGILTAVMFILGIAQVGPFPVLFFAVIWVYRESGIGWGTALLIWSTFCCTFDNVLRTLLIRRGAKVPLSVIFAGVIGGLVAFGVVGLFVGPAVLAVAYTLLLRWIGEEETIAPDMEPGGAP
jgi:predicted PurR-regulated permease PerM